MKTKIFKVLGAFFVILLCLKTVHGFVVDVHLQELESIYESALRGEELARVDKINAIALHETNQATLCRSWRALVAYKRLKNIPLLSPSSTVCDGVTLPAIKEPQKVETPVASPTPTEPVIPPTKPLAQHNVTVTTYNPVAAQTDSSPCIGASGIDQCIKAKEGVKMIAVSRDLRKFYPYKEMIFLESDNPQIQGCYLVVDTMNARFTNRVDIFHMDKSKNTSGKGVISNKIENCS